MATLSLTATVESANIPPRIKIDVTDSGAPAITAVNVTRADATGASVPVRTYDGAALPLLTSGAVRVGTVYDYEMAYGTTVTYSTSEQPAASSGAVTVTSGSAWLVHPGVPARSLPILIQEVGPRERKVQQGVFYPLGRSTPIVVTDGRRKSAGTSLSVLTFNDAERVALDLLVDDAAVLLLNVPAGNQWGVPTEYIAVGDTSESRLSRMLVQSDRSWLLPYLVVGRPVGGSQSQYSWADLMAQYATWQTVLNASATWSAAQAPTT